MSSNEATISQQSWLECAKWLDACGVIAEPLRSRLRMNNLKLNELSHAIKDGVMLCNLMNTLLPGSIDLSQIARRVEKNRSACIKNTRLFLEACKKELNLSDELLFHSEMLIDLNLERIFITLSTISKLKQVEQACGRSGFNIESSQHELDNYYNIEPIDDFDQMYTPDEAILDENDAIYQTIMNSGGSNSAASEESRHSQQANLSKRDHVTREINESETKFVKTLNIIVNDFMKQLSTILNNEDKNVIFINIVTLRNIHSELLDKLKEAIKGGHGRTSRICAVYDSYKLKLMKEYVDYFSGMQTAISKVDSLTIKSNEFKNKLEDCRKKSDMGTFKLSDLIRIPYQRVLKYHLLFGELNKNTDESHSAKRDIQVSLANMMDLAHYLNEAQRDKEILDQIDEIARHIQDFAASGLRDFGHLVKDDKVRIKENGERFVKTRTVLLFDKVLIICKSKGESYQYKSMLNLNEYKLEDSGFDSNNNSSIQINLVSTIDRSKTCSLLFKNTEDKQKNDWRSNIAASIDKISPRGYNTNNHSFALYNFEREILNCSLCKKVLLGVFYQGYKCTKCSSIAHKSCILKFQSCSGSSRTSTAGTSLPFRTTPITNTNDGRRLTKFVSYRVRGLYAYQGKPPPPDNDLLVLKFKEGDIIQVTDDDDNDWWKGFKIGSSSTSEGCFPRNHVQIIKESSNYSQRIQVLGNTVGDTTTSSVTGRIGELEIKSIENSSWYVACERESAETILNRVPSTPDSAIFLVRPRNEGGYAISIKFNSKVEHIRIHVLKFVTPEGRESVNVCLVEQIQFPSIQELISHYMANRLEDNFPQLKTTLGIPFRNALPQAISEAIALHDYDAKRMSTGVEIELVKDREYWVLSKDTMGWWKVYNSDGLIGYAPGNYLREI